MKLFENFAEKQICGVNVKSALIGAGITVAVKVAGSALNKFVLQPYVVTPIKAKIAARKEEQAAQAAAAAENNPEFPETK